MSERPLDGELIRSYVQEIVEELSPSGPQHTLIVVGGSLLAWQGLRAATGDVDSLLPVSGELREAIETVAARHGLASNWVNDRAQMFRPATFRMRDCTVLFEHPRLRVSAPPLSLVFTMKLFASRARDFDDLVVLWPHTGFEGPEQAAIAFAEGYPHEEPDPFLTEHIRGIANLAADN